MLRKFLLREIRLLTNQIIASGQLCKLTYLNLAIWANSYLIWTTCSPGWKSCLSGQQSFYQDWFGDFGLALSSNLKWLCHELWHELAIIFLAFKILPLNYWSPGTRTYKCPSFFSHFDTIKEFAKVVLQR